MDSDAPAIGYTLRDQKTNEVMKYGETTKGKKRYPESYIDKTKLTLPRKQVVQSAKCTPGNTSGY